MLVRSNASLAREDIAAVTKATLDEIQDAVDVQAAMLRPGPADDPFHEPAMMAAAMAGMACAARSCLQRCDVEPAVAPAVATATAVLGRDGFGRVDQSRLARARLEGIVQGAEQAEQTFAALAKGRPSTLLKILSEDELDITPAPDWMAAVLATKKGQSIDHLIDLDAGETLDSFPDPGTALSPLRGNMPTASIVLPAAAIDSAGSINLDAPVSELWEKFVAHKASGRHWRKEEARASNSTLQLLIAYHGDKPARSFSAIDIGEFRSMYQGLPAKYGQANPWVAIYREEGPRAVVEKSKNLKLDRTTDKSWNKLYSRLSEFFVFAGGPFGQALPPGASNPCAGLFISLDKNALTWGQDWERRRCYTSAEMEKLFSAAKFVGSASASRWRISGNLVTRDHRFWLTLIAFLHGNRREEPALLQVKHVRGLGPREIPYFDFYDKELRPLLKDSGSPRELPLHKILLALGFLEARVHGRHPEERLFPDAETTAEIAGDAGPFGQWFRQFRIFCGVDDPELDFHSTRHTFLNYLKTAGVPIAHIEALIGHDTHGRNSAFAHYDRPMRLKILRKAVDKMNVPIDVAAIMIAVKRSDALDPSAAWPDLNGPNTWARKKKS